MDKVQKREYFNFTYIFIMFMIRHPVFCNHTEEIYFSHIHFFSVNVQL
jgi:hypothetical protein